MSKTRPELFYKSQLCMALCGYSDDDLRKIVREGFIDPVTSGPSDTPKSIGDSITDSYLIFMETKFDFVILDKPDEELFEVYRKFREYEESIHPRAECPHHEESWGQIYRNIEEAHKSGNKNLFKRSLQELIDFIVHD